MPVESLSKPTVRSLFFNLVCFVISSWGLRWATTITLPPSLRQAGHKQFLTNISVIVTLFSNITNIADFFIQRYAKCPTLRNRSHRISKHTILPVALVMESIVPAVYWPLRLFAMKLIMQGIPENNSPSPIPLSVDCAIHLVPFVFLFADHYLSGSGEKFVISNKKAWVIVTLLGLSYYRFLGLLINTERGQSYPYPFLDVDEPYKSIIFVAVTSITWLFYVLYQKFPPYVSLKKRSAKKQF
ncbi:uncharacterized protein NDAI_0H03640 [Naumovozyma dairenensis CBS 421]|uniref:Uncharacterized protein n=1 Tax=Naumovozyma dairenensis (strain ATCC 10597 / BCRC 20456 / CBS 421 / NBRC 0211 / NRRL Y-12639) TaxID=1071378 RepID=G0WFH6_NAUDC|nr:hypothetical protein NDAI_0H03640 [Naumovozyma dairenensis CBS 421]CCD26537.1 hypothetical protein NDAI_0H03640 [Naumovozyma dairenensis CBS 421]